MLEILFSVFCEYVFGILKLIGFVIGRIYYICCNKKKKSNIIHVIDDKFFRICRV